MIGNIARKDLRVLLRSPLTWLAMAIMQAIIAWLFLLALEQWLAIQTQHNTRIDSAGATAWLIEQCFAPASTLLIALAPLVTMRLLADERRSSGIELLLASPVSPLQVVTGKLLAALCIYAVLLLQLGATILALSPFTSIDFGTLFSALLGLALLALTCCTIGVFFSGVTTQAPVAALASTGTLFLLWIAGIATSAHPGEINLIAWLSLSTHLQPFLQGRLVLPDFVYFVAIAGIFIVLSIRNLDNLRTVSSNSGKAQAHTVLFATGVTAIAAMLSLLAYHNALQYDATAQARHSLSASSIEVLRSMDEPLKIDAWLEPDARVQAAVQSSVERYRQHKDDIELAFFNPQTRPAEARESAIAVGGELLIRYRGREQRVSALDEQTLTHALLRLLQSHAPIVRFVSGHLERQPSAKTRNGFSDFTAHLRSLGFQFEPISLITQPAVPLDTDLLVIAAPGGDYFPGESASVLNYLAAGGNLLWLLEPGQAVAPIELAAELGISVLPGVIVDVASQQLAVDTPDFAVIDAYPEHPALSRNLQVTLFPQAAGLEFPAVVGWQVNPILSTGESSWTETGQLAGTVSHNAEAGERAGPITLGAVLTRQRGGAQQRVALIGDADFLANGWLANGGNKYLGQQLFNWLSGESTLPAIAPLQAADAQILVSKTAIAILGLGFLIVLPGIFVFVAILRWRQKTA
ncbi:MAG: Gldg family protein [Pseudomonadota bacterium]